MTEEPKTESRAERFTPDEVIAKQRNKQLIILVCVIVVLAALVAITRATRKTEAPLKEILLLGGTADSPLVSKTDIKQIQIWKGENGKHFVLNRDGEDWVVPSRFNAPVDEKGMDDLLKTLIKAARLNRASAADESKYFLYGLDDENAVHLRVLGDKDNEIMHVMIGKDETGSRDFVRLVGEDAPKGIFELTGLGGEFDTLYGAMNLDTDGQPRAGSWIDLSDFRVLPIDAELQTIELKDGDSALKFKRKPGTNESDDAWLLTSPRAGVADGTAIHAIVDALRMYSVSDIAGQAGDAAKFGLGSSKKQVSFSYMLDGKLQNAQLTFGNTNDESDVALSLSASDAPRYIYWGSDFILNRVFRKLSDVMKKERVGLVPDGANLDSLTLREGGNTTRLKRTAVGANATWTLEQPIEFEADRLAVSNLLTGLNALQGYRATSVDKQALGLGPDLSTRVITAVYPPQKADDDKDGDDTPGAEPDGDKPGEEKPTGEDEKPAEEKPEEPKPELKTATLYFGRIDGDEVPVLRVTEEGEQVFWVNAGAAARLFQLPSSYMKLTGLQLLKTGEKVQGLLINNGDTILQLTNDTGNGGDQLWHIKQPWDEIADQSEASMMLRAISMIQGAKLSEPLDADQYKLGEGKSTRQVDLQITKGEAVETATLYFGETKDGMVTGLLKRGDSEDFYLFRPADLFQFFVSPKDLRVLKPFSGKVRHILITWKGHSDRVSPKDPERTEQQAWKLANEIAERGRNGEDFVELQKQYNEDGDATHVYDVDPTAQLVKQFLRVSSELKVGEIGVVESAYGIHVIKRIE
ncbi:MAG: DUF4340 domain-containing protein [Planctomycetes bacterium]|nr:DUF4340 domain-containing protein [Planctomycetota bacterium]